MAERDDKFLEARARFAERQKESGGAKTRGNLELCNHVTR